MSGSGGSLVDGYKLLNLDNESWYQRVLVPYRVINP